MPFPCFLWLVMLKPVVKASFIIVRFKPYLYVCIHGVLGEDDNCSFLLWLSHLSGCFYFNLPLLCILCI